MVTGANDAPITADDSLTVGSDGTALIDVTANDFDPDTSDKFWVLYTSIQDTGTLGVVQQLSDGVTLSYDPAGAFDGLRAGEIATESFTYVTVDEHGAAHMASVNVTITGVNDPPVTTAGSFALDEDTLLEGSVAGDVTDPEGDTVTYALTTDAASGALTFEADGSFSYQPDADFNGTDTFSYLAEDPGGVTGTGTVTLTVNPVNDPLTGVPVLTGNFRVGEWISVDTSGIDDADGLLWLSYQWYADGVAIAGPWGDEEELKLRQAHHQKHISVELSWTDRGSTKEIVVSADSGPVLGPFMVGEDGNDTLTGTAMADEIHGVGGHDVLVGLAGDDILRGQAGRDLLKGGQGNDYLKGGGARDRLLGGAGHDRLHGGTDRDIIAGGQGDDNLTGGRQADILLFRTGWDHDTITDFDAIGKNHDVLDLGRLVSVRNWKDLKNNHLSIDGDNVVIDGKNGDKIVLENVDLADLDKGDFLY